MAPSRTLLAILSVLPLALAACAGETNTMRDLARAAGIGAEPPPPPDFVSRTRPGSTEFIPVGTSAPKRRLKAKTSGEVATADQQMERTRSANEARGAAARAQGAASPPANPATPPPR